MARPRRGAPSRRAIEVTDDRLDAPDGATVELEHGWYTRSGPWWYPVTAEEAQRLLATSTPRGKRRRGRAEDLRFAADLAAGGAGRGREV